MRRRSWLLLALPLLLGAGPVRLTLHVAEEDGEPAAGDKWLAHEIDMANQILSGSDVQVEEGERVPLGEPGPDIMTVADRHALAGAADRDGTIHVFVVRKLADKDKEGAFINGVHWRYRGPKKRYRGRRYIILASGGYPDTLAHELGHFFGLSHVEEPDNLMSYQRDGGAIFLRDRQIQRLNRRLERAMRTGRVAPAE